MYLVVLVIHVIVSLTLISLILLQHGKGADAGVAFGAAGGAGQSQNMGMTKLVGVLAVAFFATSLALGFLSSHNHEVEYVGSEAASKAAVEADARETAPDVEHGSTHRN